MYVLFFNQLITFIQFIEQKKSHYVCTIQNTNKMGLSKEHKSNNCYDFLSIKYTILKGKYK
jgi:hypothetical protein